MATICLVYQRCCVASALLYSSPHATGPCKLLCGNPACLRWHITLDTAFNDAGWRAITHAGKESHFCAGGHPVATEELRYGMRLAVICLPADAMLLTPEALQVVGPRAFGLQKLGILS